MSPPPKKMSQSLDQAQKHLNILNNYHSSLVQVFSKHVDRSELSPEDVAEIALLDTKLLSASNSYNANFLKIIGKYVSEQNLSEEDKTQIQSIRAVYQSESQKLK